MAQHAIPAVFARGGTSTALIFHQRDLPADREAWPAIFMRALGTPDPSVRQLDGMGGGLSSLSKICVVGPSTRPDADIDYLFGQVGVTDAFVSYAGNCGNMSSAIGPFALEEGLVAANGDEAVVRIHNVNTNRIIRAHFALLDGAPRVDGDLAIPGVAGTGAPIKLVFEDPGGAGTGLLLPTGNAIDLLTPEEGDPIEVSIVDAANPVCFVRASDLGLTGAESPFDLDKQAQLLARLRKIAKAASAQLPIKPGTDAPKRIGLVSMIAPPVSATLLDGQVLAVDAVDFTVRMISSGQPHRASPLTGAVCAGVASAIDGTIVAQARGPQWMMGAIRIGTPSGMLMVAADVSREASGWVAREGSVYRTQRRLFQGAVLVPKADVLGVA
jgi:2-methylaconitate cis-trans-isomerase PrpF